MLGGDFELQVALALQAAEGEGVAVHAAEEVGVCGDLGAHGLGVGGHFFDGVAAGIGLSDYACVFMAYE